MHYSKEDCLRFVEENDVRFIRLQFADMFGRMKNVAIMDKQLPKVLESGFRFDGFSISGLTGAAGSDLFLFPDPDTLAIIPWRPQQGKVARLICDIKNHDGSQYEGDSRHILKRTLQKTGEQGLLVHVGLECEFFMFYNDDEGKPTTVTKDTAGYFDLAPIDQGENTRREICLVLEEMGVEVKGSYHGTAAGQHALDFSAADPLTAADNMMTFKMVVKIIAQRNGFHGTFMPKPFPEMKGSGMYLNLSLRQKGSNLFGGEGCGEELSDTARGFMAGILKHSKGIAAIANPLVNSYKRLKPGLEAPVHIAWSQRRRDSLLRISAPRQGEGGWLEIRSADPACNPYLTLALLLEAGLAGIKAGLPLGDPWQESLQNLTLEEEAAARLERLPANLWSALAETKKDPLVQETLGRQMFDQYVAAKVLEWEDYDNSIHQWEFDKYLKSF